MSRAMSNLSFRMMSFGFKVRDFFKPRDAILADVGIKQGHFVLDYGCGPGSYVKKTAELVGAEGRVYALDIHPLAINKVKKLAREKGFDNVETINSDCYTGLADASIDIVLLYDTFHNLENTDAVLAELHRVLKTDGILSISDHHLSDDEIESGICSSGLFTLASRGEKTHSFKKA